jgi:SAM-dependent methyltransferase
MATDPGDLLQRSEGRTLFGADPQRYEAGRPDYPDRVYQVLAERCGLRAAIRILEIGPGTGLVTRHLLAAGASVTAVEPDGGLAGYLADTYPDVEVVAASLEEAVLPAAEFDLAVAATSLHWVDQQIGLNKLGRCVRPGGWVAVWWTLFRDPGRPDPFAQAVEEILGPSTRGAFDEPGRPPFQLDREHRLRDLDRWAGLSRLESEQFHSPCVFSAREARALYASMATVLRRPAGEQERLLDAIEELVVHRFGGEVERQFVTAMYTGRRP